MAKRIFEIARELNVKSKAVIVKCADEGIPDVNNHMSSVSAGLEATIREWFTEEATSSTHNAVETTAHVDLEKVRIKKKPAKAKAKAEATTIEPPASDTTVAVAEPVVAPSIPAAAPAAPEEPAQPEPVEIAPAKPQELVPAASAPATEAPAEEAKPEVAAPQTPEKETPAKAPAPVENVPVRPTTVTPAGPQLDVRKPARLSGPKIIRVEAPEQMPQPRRRTPVNNNNNNDEPAIPTARGPRTGGGVGAKPGGPADDSARRNKRRSGGKRNDRGGGGAWRAKDLAEREARLSRSGGFLRQRRRATKRKDGAAGNRATTAADTGGPVKISEPFTIKDLSAATGVRSSEIIKRLFLQDIMSTVNSGIDPEKASEIMIEFDIELEVEEAKSAEDVVVEQFEKREITNEQPRSPVVTILGHVDHGKTSLLDRIRNAKVASGEAGGITQATSAFRVPVGKKKEGKHVVFIDTPGHEAFTEMRSRGAQVTDIVVLVVAADDGVMPQTVESINHAKAAGVPVVVALNKIDKPESTDSQIQKIYGQLAEHELNPTEWGGNTEVIKTSAETGEGIESLLETLDLQAQLLELTADFAGPVRGAVIESEILEGRGPVANILITDGLLNIGEFIVAGRAFGRVRDIRDDRGNRIKQASPAMPVQVSGLDSLPDAGDKCYSVDSLKKAQNAAEMRRDNERERELAQPKVTLETMLGQMQAGVVKEFRVVIKADVQGSIDVLRKTAEDIKNDEVKVRVLHTAVGGVTDSDVLLANASQAIIIGFNVIPTASARKLAEEKGVQIRSYRVIYDIVDDLIKAAEGLLEPEIRENILGHADVRAVFKISKVGSIAGCYVTDGVIERNAFMRVTRDGVVVEHDRILEQLKRVKDDAKEVRSGNECGMKIIGYDDIKEGDVIECYRKVEIKRSL